MEFNLIYVSRENRVKRQYVGGNGKHDLWLDRVYNLAIFRRTRYGDNKSYYKIGSAVGLSRQ